MYTGSGVGGCLASPGYEKELLQWEVCAQDDSRDETLTPQDAELHRIRDPETQEVVGLETILTLRHFKGFQEGEFHILSLAMG